MSRRRSPSRRGRASSPAGAHGAPRPPRGDNGALIWGRHAAAAALANPRRVVRRITLTADATDALAAMLAPLTNSRRAALPPPTLADRDAVAALCPEGAVHQGVVLTVAPLPGFDLTALLARLAPPAPCLLLVLDQVTDPRNVGAILRSAAAFGVDGVVLPDRHAPPETGTLARAASGALDVVPLVRVGNLARALDSLKESGVWLYGLDSEAPETLGAVDMPGRMALLLGAEDSGLRRLTREACDALLRLPTQPPVASLNVSNAAAVALFAARQRRGG